MALLFADGFNERWTNSQHVVDKYEDYNVPVTSYYGWQGAYRTDMSTFMISGGYLEKRFSSHATWIAGFAGCLSNGGTISAGKILEFLDGTTSQIYVRLNADRTLSVVNGGGTVLGTSTATYAINALNYLEFKATINNTTGSFELRQNGVNILSGTNVDTQNSANATANRVKIQNNNGGGGSTYLIFDDYYICDGSGSINNDFLNCPHVGYLLPNGNGNSSVWLGSDGNSVNNYQLVDDSSWPNDGTDYVAASAVGDKDTYAVQDSSATILGLIHGVQTELRAAKDDGTARTICAVARPGTTDYDGSAHTMTTSYLYYTNVWETNPDTGNRWTKSEINNSEFGIKVVS